MCVVLSPVRAHARQDRDARCATGASALAGGSRARRGPRREARAREGPRARPEMATTAALADPPRVQLLERLASEPGEPLGARPSRAIAAAPREDAATA